MHEGAWESELNSACPTYLSGTLHNCLFATHCVPEISIPPLQKVFLGINSSGNSSLVLSINSLALETLSSSKLPMTFQGVGGVGDINGSLGTCLIFVRVWLYFYFVFYYTVQRTQTHTYNHLNLN